MAKEYKVCQVRVFEEQIISLPDSAVIVGATYVGIYMYITYVIPIVALKAIDALREPVAIEDAALLVKADGANFIIHDNLSNLIEEYNNA